MSTTSTARRWQLALIAFLAGLLGFTISRAGSTGDYLLAGALLVALVLAPRLVASVSRRRQGHAPH